MLREQRFAFMQVEQELSKSDLETCTCIAAWLPYVCSVEQSDKAVQDLLERVHALALSSIQPADAELEAMADALVRMGRWYGRGDRQQEASAALSALVSLTQSCALARAVLQAARLFKAALPKESYEVRNAVMNIIITH